MEKQIEIKDFAHDKTQEIINKLRNVKREFVDDLCYLS